MSHYFYITPEEYEIAEANGIDAFNLERRIRLLGWSKESALKEPLEKKTDRQEWAKVAKSNGIKYQTFMSRVNSYGMSEEEAATKPIQDRTKAVKKATDAIRKLPKEWVEVAISNGIKYHTFRSRVNSGMDPKEAATKKIMSNSESGKLGAKSYEEKYGRFHKLIFKQVTEAK